MNWQLIESDTALESLMQQAAGCEALIVDTEFMRRNTFFPQVALVQLCFEAPGSTADTAWLIDPLTIDNPAPLADMLTNPDMPKVLHSASEDLEVFQHWLGVLPRPLFDTQRAAAMVDIGFGMGYRALVQEISDIDLPKGETRSDWLQRPLTPSQCEYAALDVTCLLPVWRELQQRCVEQGKLEWVLADGADALAAMEAVGNDYYKRIKGGWKLNARQLAALMAISDWREATARSRDKPRSWIIDDRACLQLAQQDPGSFGALREEIELPAPVLRRYGEELLDVLAQVRQLAEADLPSTLPPPLTAPQRDVLKKLKSRARDIARELGMAPEALLQGKDYELLLREAAGETVPVPQHWLGWREARVVAPLRKTLAGQR